MAKKLPAMLFYPGDWRKSMDVQSLTYEERGVWFEMLCFMHEAPERGKLPLESLPQLLGLDQAKVKQIIDRILSKKVANLEGDFIVCRRMVRQEEIRGLRQIYGSIGGQVHQANVVANAPKQNQALSISVSSSSSISISNKILKYFGKVHLEKTGQKYTASFQKDHTLLNRLLENHTEKDLMVMIDRFFVEENDFVRRAGYTVGVFSSQVPRMIARLVSTKSPFDFNVVFNKYPELSRILPTECQEIFNATVKTERDFKAIQDALDNYLTRERKRGTKKEFIKDAPKWFAEWRDWRVDN